MAKETQGIMKAMHAIMSELDAIEKTGFNKHFKYDFRGIDHTLKSLQPKLVKHGVLLVPTVLEVFRDRSDGKRFASVTVQYTFICIDDGSSQSITVVGDGEDTGDKGINKAMSAAFKTAIFQTFCVPTESAQDSEDDSNDASAHKPAPKPDAKVTKDDPPVDMHDPSTYATSYDEDEVTGHFRLPDGLDMLSTEELRGLWMKAKAANDKASMSIIEKVGQKKKGGK